MEEDENTLAIIIEESVQHAKGLFAANVKCKTSTFIWMWCSSKLTVYEVFTIGINNGITSNDKGLIQEIQLEHNVITVFQLNDGLIYVLDAGGIFHSFQLEISNSNSPAQFMDVDDIFSSPPYTDTYKWKEQIVARVKNCDSVERAIHFTAGCTILVRKDDCLTVHVYSLPEFRFKFFFDLHKYNAQVSVLSCCKISTLAPSLRLHFQDNLEVLDDEIILIGLCNGLILWLISNQPKKGPFVLFSAHNNVKNAHWVKDDTTSYVSHLLIVLSAGSVIIIGQQKTKTVFLPSPVNRSWCLREHLLTTNLVDCYNSNINLTDKVGLNSLLLPVKGVCAIAECPDSTTSILVATVYGIVYCLNVTATPIDEISASFTIPEEEVLDNLMVQTKNLESVYKQLSEEESILRAISTAMIVNNNSQLFHLTLKIVSDNKFCLVTKLAKKEIFFSKKLWLANVEITRKHGYKQSSYNKLCQDFSVDNDLQMSDNNSLMIGDVVCLELILWLEAQQPVLTVPIDKVEIDAGYMMVNQVFVLSQSVKEESFEEILFNINNHDSPLRKTLQECKLHLKIPDNIGINSVLPLILHNSQHRISSEEWDKLNGGTKHNIQVNINGIAILIHIDVSSRLLTLTSCDILLCHNLKEAVLNRLKTKEDKVIPENVALGVQALKQEFEIEIFKEHLDFKCMETMRKKLRSTLSSHFLL